MPPLTVSKEVPYTGTPGKPPAPSAINTLSLGTSEIISSSVVTSPSTTCHHGEFDGIESFTVKIDVS